MSKHWQIVFQNNVCMNRQFSREYDFGDIWYAIPCSQEYYRAAEAAFKFLENNKGVSWDNLPDKADAVYTPLMTAIRDELLRAYGKDPSMLSRMVMYFVEHAVFYKIKSVENDETDNAIAGSGGDKSYPKADLMTDGLEKHLPTYIIHMEMVPRSVASMMLCLNNGWQIKLTLICPPHTARETLRLSVQIVGVPLNAITHRIESY